jgi:hypothetical protein
MYQQAGKTEISAKVVRRVQSDASTSRGFTKLELSLE